MKSKNIYLPHGTKGVIQMTDKINYLDAGGQQNFEAKIEALIQCSYF